MLSLFKDGIDGVPILAGWHWEVRVAVGEHAVELCELVDDDEGRTSGYGCRHSCWVAQ